MSIHTFTSRQFNQDVGRAKKAAAEGPVFITDRGRPAHVLLSIQEYRRLTWTGQNIVDLVAMQGADDLEFDPPQAQGLSRPADLS